MAASPATPNVEQMTGENGFSAALASAKGWTNGTRSKSSASHTPGTRSRRKIVNKVWRLAASMSAV